MAATDQLDFPLRNSDMPPQTKFYLHYKVTDEQRASRGGGTWLMGLACCQTPSALTDFSLVVSWIPIGLNRRVIDSSW